MAAAIWMIANAKSGISSYELHRVIGMAQKSAWFVLHRIRLAMQTGTFEKLSGEVEADETFIGGKINNMQKRPQDRRNPIPSIAANQTYSPPEMLAAVLWGMSWGTLPGGRRL